MDNVTAKKLFLRPGQRVLIVGAPPAWPESLRASHPDLQTAPTSTGSFDFILSCINRLIELPAVAGDLTRLAAPDAKVWIAYPKRTSTAAGLGRDEVRVVMQQVGWNTVAIVALDEHWSALRFRPLVCGD